MVDRFAQLFNDAERWEQASYKSVTKVKPLTCKHRTDIIERM
ncbi:hypothetical protein [Pseudoflavonifractor sp. An44]|nr:hypothetical protein [Pseudoflavonifractor sp. An44]